MKYTHHSTLGSVSVEVVVLEPPTVRIRAGFELRCEVVAPEVTKS